MSDCDLTEARRACADVTDMLRGAARKPDRYWQKARSSLDRRTVLMSKHHAAHCDRRSCESPDFCDRYRRSAAAERESLGGPPPRVGICQRVGTKELVSFSFSADIVARLRWIARREGRSLSNLLGVLVEGAVYRIDFREPGDEWARKWLRQVRG